MRLVIQRVSEASVSVDGLIQGRIQKGMLVLLGIEEADNQDDIEWLCAKLAGLRIFDDADGVMNIAPDEAGAGFLVISQFTLFASTKKGNRPSYSRAAKGTISFPVYEAFIQCLEKRTGKKVQTGIFGADMKVALINDGPVTILMDSKNKE